MSTFNFYVFFLCIFFVVYILYSFFPPKRPSPFFLYIPHKETLFKSTSFTSYFSMLLLPLTVVPVVRSIYNLQLYALGCNPGGYIERYIVHSGNRQPIWRYLVVSYSRHADSQFRSMSILCRLCRRTAVGECVLSP